MNPNEQLNGGVLDTTNQPVQPVAVPPQGNVQQVQPMQQVETIQTPAAILQQPIQTEAPTLPTQGQALIKKKKNNKLILIVLLVAVVLGVGYYFLNGTHKKNSNNPLTNGSGEKIEVKTDKEWGDKYALYFQDFYSELIYDEDPVKAKAKAEIERDFEMLFIDFDFDEVPEMVIKYNDNTKNIAMRVFQYNNGKVSESKDFRNCSFKMLYSLKSKEVDWYIYITSTNKYGAYTRMDKILSNVALDSDIKVTNDKEITDFNKSYVISSYDTAFFKLSLKEFEANFKNAVSKYDEINKSINENKSKLIADYSGNAGGNVETPPVVEPENISVGQYTLEYGKYMTEVDVIELGEVTDKKQLYITINKDGTLIDEEQEVTKKYSVYTSSISIDDGTPFKVTDNNKFVYGQGDGREYSFVQ